MLIAGGHAWLVAKDYSIKQAQAFVKLYQERCSLLNKESAIAMRVAYHAEGKDFKDFLGT